MCHYYIAKIIEILKTCYCYIAQVIELLNISTYYVTKVVKLLNIFSCHLIKIEFAQCNERGALKNFLQLLAVK